MFLSLEYCFTIGQLKRWGITYRQPTVISLFALLNSPFNLQITSMVSYQSRLHTLHVIYTSHSVTSFMKCPGSLRSTKYHLWSGMIGEPLFEFSFIPWTIYPSVSKTRAQICSYRESHYILYIFHEMYLDHLYHDPHYQLLTVRSWALLHRLDRQPGNKPHWLQNA